MSEDVTTPPTRPSLILRLRNQDDLTAWEEFVEVYQPLVHSLAIRRGLQAADAEDVTQEVLTRVARSIEGWDPNPRKGSFRGWLATITRNTAIQSLRERDRRPLAGLDSSLTERADERTEQQFDVEHERQLFAWAARREQARFQPRTWQAFWFTAVQNKSVAEVAAELGMSTAQIYVARSRVMSALRRTIEQSNFDHPEKGSRT